MAFQQEQSHRCNEAPIAGLCDAKSERAAFTHNNVMEADRSSRKDTFLREPGSGNNTLRFARDQELLRKLVHKYCG